MIFVRAIYGSSIFSISAKQPKLGQKRQVWAVLWVARVARSSGYFLLSKPRGPSRATNLALQVDSKGSSNPLGC